MWDKGEQVIKDPLELEDIESESGYPQKDDSSNPSNILSTWLVMFVCTCKQLLG